MLVTERQLVLAAGSLERAANLALTPEEDEALRAVAKDLRKRALSAPRYDAREAA